VPLPHHIAILSLTSDVSTRSLLQATAAIQKQVTRDFGPIWGIQATVDAFDDLLDVPNDYHHVALFGDSDELMHTLVATIGEEPALRLLDAFDHETISGIHLNALTNQPFALVSVDDPWTVVLSHEVLEMLADPWGNQLVAAPHPLRRQQRVRYLVEVCDPCMSTWYPVNGVPVADFYTPRYFDPVVNSGVRYSYTGSIEHPQQILEGGYVTYIDPADSALYQLHHGREDPIRLAGLPELATSAVPLRTIVDMNPNTPRVTLDSVSPAGTAVAVDGPLVGVAEAAQGAALNTAEALYSLVKGLG
jgi:hypothetical protein